MLHGKDDDCDRLKHGALGDEQVLSRTIECEVIDLSNNCPEWDLAFQLQDLWF
jgi:hypothetical protein